MKLRKRRSTPRSNIMNSYKPDKIRNVVLLSHYGAGKTSLAESMLFNSGAIKRLGSVDNGTTTSDYDPGEIDHHMSINLSLLSHGGNGNMLNLIDTPGYADFAGEVRAALRVCEGAVIVIVWRWVLSKYGITQRR